LLILSSEILDKSSSSVISLTASKSVLFKTYSYALDCY
jgi:hypothetical protein